MISAQELLKQKVKEYSDLVMSINKSLEEKKQVVLEEYILETAKEKYGTEKKFNLEETTFTPPTSAEVHYLAHDLKTAKETYEALLNFQSSIGTKDLASLETQWLEEINKLTTW